MDMNNKELPRGRQTFGITTPLPPVREKELAPPPTPEEVKAANTGAYAGSTRTVERVGKNRVLKAVLRGGVVVAGGSIAYQEVPAVHRAVDSAFLDHLRGKLYLQTHQQ